MNNNEDDFVLVKSKVVRQVDSEDSMRMGSYDIRTLEAKVMNIGECLYDKATFEDLQQFEVPGQSSSRERAWKTIVTIEDGTAVRLGLGYLIKKGVPNAKRRDVWLALAGVKHFLKKDVHLKGSYCSRLVEVFGERVPLSIQKPPLFGFKESFESHFLTAQGLEACKRILCVFAMENPGIVYSPSIVDLVCLFLHYVTEEEAYYMLNYVLKNTENRNYHIPTSKKDCQKVIFTFANFLEHKSKHLYHHIQSLNFDTEFFEKWLIRFFVGEMPYSKVIRILDAFLLEGYSILFRVGLALLLENQNSLMKCTDGKNFTNMLQQITTQLIDDNTLMKVYCATCSSLC
uniref:Rab-GAP TBC domain-containing protein n=1 Tax=Arcella intermedia TaxID=1963864 RepID=A0A6B2L873_9EUKA